MKRPTCREFSIFAVLCGVALGRVNPETDAVGLIQVGRADLQSLHQERPRPKPDEPRALAGSHGWAATHQSTMSRSGVYEKLEHLRGMAGSVRTTLGRRVVRRRTEATAGNPLADQDIASGIHSVATDDGSDPELYAGMCTYMLCIPHFLHGHNEKRVRQVYGRHYSDYIGKNVEVNTSYNEEKKTVTCRVTEFEDSSDSPRPIRTFTSTRRFIGKRFGCVHEGLWENDAPAFSWDARGAAIPPDASSLSNVNHLGVDPDGSATRSIDGMFGGVEDSSSTSGPMTAPEFKSTCGATAVELFLESSKAGADAQLDGMLATVVSYRGTVVGETYRDGLADATTLLHGWSATKSILGLLVGAREAEGKLDLDALAQCPELSQGEKEDRGMTVDNMLLMRVGKPLPEISPGGTPWLYFMSPDAASYAAMASTNYSKPDGGSQWQVPVSPHFYYSSGTSVLLSRELRYTFPAGPQGQAEYTAYPWKTIFKKIGAESFLCEGDPAGNFFFSAGCWATARDWVRVGQLVLQRGVWEGEQVLPSEFIDKISGTVEDDSPYYTRGWYRLDAMYSTLDTPVIAAMGTYGQYVVVVPELELIVARFGFWDDSGLVDLGSATDDGATAKGLLANLIESLRRSPEECRAATEGIF